MEASLTDSLAARKNCVPYRALPGYLAEFGSRAPGSSLNPSPPPPKAETP